MYGTRSGVRRWPAAADRLAGTLLLGMALEAVMLYPLHAQCGQSGKEYVRLGGRVIAIENYQQLAAPTFSPPGGTVSSSSVTVSAASGAVIYYTTDGATPSCSSAHSSSNTLSLTVISGETVKAFAVQAGLQDSPVSSATYTLGTSSATLSPSSASFGLQQLSVPSVPQTFTLTNSGSLPLTVGVISATGDFAQTANDCGTSLAAAASCAISVTFTPTALLVRSGTLTAAAQTATLSGTGVSKTLSPTSLSFGNQNVGSSSSQTVTVSFSGGAPLTISGIGITPATPFTLAANTCGSGLASGATCTITVTFSPSVAGASSATLNITDNAAGSPHTVALSGTGVGALPSPLVTLTPASLSFGNQAMGQTSPAQTVTVTNTGNAALSIWNTSVTDPEFGYLHNCGTVAPGGSCTFQVTYTPSALGSHSATLSFVDNAPGAPHNVALSGTGQTQLAPPTYTLDTFTTWVPGTPVTITAPSGASILYTSDGSNPLTSSTAHLVGSPFTFTIDNTVTLGAVSRQSGMADSAVAWRVYGTNVVTLSPTGGVTLTSGQFTTFMMSGTASDQWNSINDYLIMEISPGPDHWYGTCNVQYQPVTGTVFLVLDNGISWASGAIGSNNVLSNSQCTLNLAGATAFRTGTALTVSMPVSFRSSFAGVRALWVNPYLGYSNWFYFSTDIVQANSVTVTPDKVSLYSGQPQQFSSNTAANWSMSPQSGTLSGPGVYTAPSSIASQQVVTVTATSQTDATKFANAAVTLVPGIPVDLHLTNLTIFSGSPTYQATHSITADTNVVVGGTANVTFRAGSTITLDPGFRATAVGTGTAFHAVIQ